MAKTKAQKIEDVAAEMRELGYRIDASRVERLLEWHKSNPLPGDAALAANVLQALSEKGIKIT